MRKFTPTISRLGAIILIGLLTLSVNAQDIASLIPAMAKPGGTTQGDRRTKPLKRLLAELENRYQVSFNYDSELIRHVVVENREVNTDLEAALNQLLEQQELRCKKIGEKTYVIYPKDDETLEPIPSLPGQPKESVTFDHRRKADMRIAKDRIARTIRSNRPDDDGLLVVEALGGPAIDLQQACRDKDRADESGKAETKTGSR